ncbi:MAG TPA: DUF1249 domain-containing protein [Candidatus Competibacter sp.]|nr:DUF1249 domain-containing protein [Candidatus Competibacteraceae bacterium]HRC73028.1 DUF1249 domain-containing protein [Candidatus Competibacter sp.]
MILLSPPHVRSLARNEPGTFPALMDLYECNYINMRRLIPTLPKQPAALISHIPDGLDLHLRLIERFRYTSEVSLTYYFSGRAGLFPEPDLRIRIYHDARLAEVLNAQLRGLPAFDSERFSFQHADGTLLHRRWQINRFLFKWLNYCLRQGHRFSESPSPSPPGPPSTLKI